MNNEYHPIAIRATELTIPPFTSDLPGNVTQASAGKRLPG
jgi:hypothetical protein